MKDLTLIKRPIVEELSTFEELFNNSLTSSNDLLSSVIKHLRKRNGKMMRPMLVLLIAKLCGGVHQRSYDAAVSLELLHTASLIHDDVVDESTERRGQLSVNAIFNNKISVLSGDYLLATSLVYAELTKSHHIINVISVLGQELSEGELLQLSNISNDEFSESIYYEVIRKKTAALFSACTRVGAFSVNDNLEHLDFATKFGEYIGICFQIRDDIFDYYEDSAIGKPTGNDMREGKLTLPVLHVLNQSKDTSVRDIALKVKHHSANDDEIAYLVDYTKSHGGIEYAISVMNNLRDKAKELLEEFPDSEVRIALSTYIDYVVDRTM